MLCLKEYKSIKYKAIEVLPTFACPSITLKFPFLNLKYSSISGIPSL